MAKPKSFPDADRHRAPVRITMDPKWRARAEAMAEARGMVLSRFIETLIRAEHEREARRGQKS